MKNLLTKPFTDRLLRNLGFCEEDLMNYNKTFSSVIYTTGEIEVIVTADATRRDLLNRFNLLREEYNDTRQTDEGYSFFTAEVEEVPHGKHYMLPVYVLEAYSLPPVAPGHGLHGSLKRQCTRAMQLWNDTDVRNPYLKPENGVVLSALAEQFWKMVLKNKSLNLLHSLAEFCLAYEEHYIPYLPNLSASNFKLNDADEVVPYDAVQSLAVYGISHEMILYKTREEY